MTGTLDAQMAEMDKICQQLESDKTLTLEQSIALYERGRELHSLIHAALDAAEQRMTVTQIHADGETVLAQKPKSVGSRPVDPRAPADQGTGPPTGQKKL